MRLLIIEDEALIAYDLAQACADAGHTVVGTATTIEDATARIDGGGYDVVALDLNLDGERTYGLADTLAERGVPFAFLTGYPKSFLPERHRGRPMCVKPCRIAKVVKMLGELKS